MTVVDFACTTTRPQSNAPSGWIGIIDISRCNALGIDLPGGGLQGRLPCGLRYRWYQANSDAPEQRAYRAARRQMDADTRDVLDHFCSNFEEPISNCRKLGSREGIGFRNG